MNKHLSLPPTDSNSSPEALNRTFVTWDECPVNSKHLAFSVAQGYRNNFTEPKSSAVARMVPNGDLSTELISVPSAPGGQIPCKQ